MKKVGLVTSVGCALPPVTAKRLSGFAELNLKSTGVDPDFPGLIVVNFPEIPSPRVLPKKSPPFCVIAFISDGGRGSPEKNTPLVSLSPAFEIFANPAGPLWPVGGKVAIRRQLTARHPSVADAQF